MALTDLPDWIDEHSRPPCVWFVKRLQANDTLATGSHQAGPYLPKEFLFAVFTELEDRSAHNPRVEFDIYVDSQGGHRRVRAIWYNNELRGKTRNETRITGFGGAASDLLDPESTGAIAVLAFNLEEQPAPSCHVWVCRDDTESDLIEGIVGEVDPTRPIVWVAAGTPEPENFMLRRGRTAAPRHIVSTPNPTAPTPQSAPAPQMPTVETLVRRSQVAQPLNGQSVDIRLLRRHEALIDLFEIAEEEAYAERVRAGFPDLRTMLELADRLRKARQSRGDDALAFQMRDLLEEEGLSNGTDFVLRPDLDEARPPDLVFPTLDRYARGDRAASLYIEQSIRDRWRPITTGSGDAGRRNVLTIQRGVSEAQFAEMSAAGLSLIVPMRLHDTYPGSIRNQLRSVESFLADVRHLSG